MRVVSEKIQYANGKSNHNFFTGLMGSKAITGKTLGKTVGQTRKTRRTWEKSGDLGKTLWNTVGQTSNENRESQENFMKVKL